MEQDKSSKINTPIQNLVEGTQKDGTVGPLVGSIIVILILLVGGLYFLETLISAQKTEIQTQEVLESQGNTLQIEETVKQSTSDEVEAIEADLRSTNIDDLDKDLNQI